MNASHRHSHSVKALSAFLCLFLPAAAVPALGEKEPASPMPYAQERSQLFEWNIQTLVGAYERVGKKHPKWDAPARKALTLYARNRSGGSSADQSHQMREASRSAIGAGCADPLISYVLYRSMEDMEGGITPARKAEMRKIADTMIATAYPAIRKFYACVRAAGSEKDAAGRRFTPEAKGYKETAEQYLFEMLKDKSIPALEIHDACRAFGRAIHDDSDAFKKFIQAIEGPIADNWTNAFLLPLIRGHLYVDHAWAARGTGTADTVSGTGWQHFGERLRVAANELETAWRLNPGDPHAASSMIEIGKGQGYDKAQMEKWFQRAMNAYTNNYTACRSKLSYLQPKWHGSPEEALAFGQECLRSTNWGGSVPLIAVEVFEKLAEYVPSSGRAAYWRRPDIWPTIEAAYEKYFRSTEGPHTSSRSRFLLFAYRCERWDEFNKTLAQMDSVQHSVLGGKQSCGTAYVEWK